MSHCTRIDIFIKFVKSDIDISGIIENISTGIINDIICKKRWYY